MTKQKLVAVIIEVTGIVVTSAGIGVELATHADIGWVTMTVGSLLLAIGGLIYGKFIQK